MDPPPRAILHVDMDAFYASVEVRDDPTLRGRPVVVGSDPKGGRGRGVVCTASYEARKFGIRSAMPIGQAYRACPTAAFLRPDFRRYSAASKKVMEVLGRYADVLEVVGMDEAYLDVTQRVRGDDGAPDWDLARSLGHSLQAAVARATGLSCSVGIAPTKSLAKIGSDARKPHGVLRITPKEALSYLHPLPVCKLHGCGPKTTATLADMGIRTIGDLAAAPPQALERLGSHGSWLHELALGRDPRQVSSDRGHRKSRGNETTFPEDEADPDRVASVAADLLDEVLADAPPFSTITVKIRYQGYATRTRSRTVSPLPPTAWGNQAAHAVVSDLLRPMLGSRRVRLVGVRLSNFTGAQQPLSHYGVEWAGIVTPALHGAPPTPLAWTRLDDWAAPHLKA